MTPNRWTQIGVTVSTADLITAFYATVNFVILGLSVSSLMQDNEAKTAKPMDVGTMRITEQ